MAVVDLAGLGWSHISQLTPHYARAMVAILQSAFPLRFRQIHVIHAPRLFQVILAKYRPNPDANSPLVQLGYSLVRPLLTARMAERVVVHCRSPPPGLPPTPQLSNSDALAALHSMEQSFERLQQIGSHC